MRAQCTICSKPVVGFGLCNAHYIAFKKYGDPGSKLNRRNIPFSERYVVDTETHCWIWLNATKQNRYGSWHAYGEDKPHRASWVMHNGAIPEGQLVLHKCDRPGCVNPDHLFLGTQDDNMKDMKSKRRTRESKGTSNTNSKLNEQQVQLIRNSPLTHKELSEIFGVHVATIRSIRKGALWAHLPYKPSNI